MIFIEACNAALTAVGVRPSPRLPITKGERSEFFIQVRTGQRSHTAVSLEVIAVLQTGQPVVVCSSNGRLLQQRHGGVPLTARPGTVRLKTNSSHKVPSVLGKNYEQAAGNTSFTFILQRSQHSTVAHVQHYAEKMSAVLLLGLSDELLLADAGFAHAQRGARRGIPTQHGNPALLWSKRESTHRCVGPRESGSGAPSLKIGDRYFNLGLAWADCINL